MLGRMGEMLELRRRRGAGSAARTAPPLPREGTARHARARATDPLARARPRGRAAARAARLAPAALSSLLLPLVGARRRAPRLARLAARGDPAQRLRLLPAEREPLHLRVACGRPDALRPLRRGRDGARPRRGSSCGGGRHDPLAPSGSRRPSSRTSPRRTRPHTLHVVLLALLVAAVRLRRAESRSSRPSGWAGRASRPPPDRPRTSRCCGCCSGGGSRSRRRCRSWRSSPSSRCWPPPGWASRAPPTCSATA